MASTQSSSFRKLLLLYLVLFLFASLLVSSFSQVQPKRRKLLATAETVKETKTEQPKKKTNLSTKNQTKLIKPTINSTKTTPPTTTTLSKTLFKKLNNTSKISNSIKTNSTSSTKKSLGLSTKPVTPNKNKTQPIITKVQSKTPIVIEKKPKQQKIQKTTKPTKLNWIDLEDSESNEDLVKEFRDLPSKFQQTLFPDLERFSTTSKAYITKANKEITEGFKPLVGNKYAPTIASVISFIFILAPLLLVSLIFNRIKAYFSLQKILIFIQVYLSIYFSILSLASLISGLEPLKFFYATSQSSYVCLQVLQTLGYVMYLLLLLMYLIVVFSTETGFGLKGLGLAQTIVGFSVGLHYYVSVFHRAVLHQPPKTNWKIHGIYATCFLLICLFAGAERRKKAYLEDGGEEGKKN